MQSKPIKITIEVLGGSVPKVPIHFDDLIASAAVNRYQREQGVVEDYDSILHALPIDNHDGVYKASILLVETKRTVYFQRPFSRRTNEEQLAALAGIDVVKYRAKTINTNSGPFKSSIGTIHSYAHATFTAYCVGDPSAIESLLEEIEYLGRKHNRGSGKILNVTIEPSSEANELWQYRNMPLSDKTMKLIDKGTHSLAIGSTRSPYWQPSHMTYCVVPVSQNMQ